MLFLLLIQLVLKKKILDIIKVILFFVNFRKKLNLFKKSKDIKLAQLAFKKTNILKQIYKNITKIQKKSVNYEKKTDILIKRKQ